MNYIYVEKDNQSASYLVTTSCNQPRINIGNAGYIPLVMGTTNAPMVKVAPANGYDNVQTFKKCSIIYKY